MPNLIYLDTNLWNALFDQLVEPHAFMLLLRRAGSNLVLGPHCWYEIAKTCQSPKPLVQQRGIELFKYVGQFLDQGVLCAKDNRQLLSSEVEAVNSRSEHINPMLEDSAIPFVKELNNKMTTGSPDEMMNEFLIMKEAGSASLRVDQALYLSDRPDHKKLLQSIAPNDLRRVMQILLEGASGAKILADEIKAHYPDADMSGIVDCVSVLKSSPVGRFSRGFIRSVIYYSWRCAHRGSNRRDLADDTYHILNSAHCHYYVTAEQNHKEYAGLLLGSETEVRIYDRALPLQEWLLGLV